MKPIITYKDVEEQFEQAEEELATTLSGVDIYIAKDVHYESLGMNIGIFGEDSTEAPPVVTQDNLSTFPGAIQETRHLRVARKCIRSIYDVRGESILRFNVALDFVDI